MSIFDTVFKFSHSGSRRPLRLPALVRAELRMAADLMPMLVVDLKVPYSTKVIAHDASLWGGGVVYSSLSLEVAKRMHHFSIIVVGISA